MSVDTELAVGVDVACTTSQATSISAKLQDGKTSSVAAGKAVPVNISRASGCSCAYSNVLCIGLINFSICLGFLVQFSFFAFCEKQLYFLSPSSKSSFSSTRKTILKMTQNKNFTKYQYNVVMALFLRSMKIFSAQTINHYHWHIACKNIFIGRLAVV